MADLRSDQPYVWLIAANLIWVVAGALAYWTPIGLTIGTAVAVVPAFAGFRAARGLWADRGLTFTMGTWATAAMLVVIPYAATDKGISLWSSHSFAVLGIAVAGIGMLLLGVATWKLLDLPQGRRAAIAHAILIIASIWAAFYWPPTSSELVLRSGTIQSLDLSMAPAILAVPGGAMWALIVWDASRRSGDPAPA